MIFSEVIMAVSWKDVQKELLAIYPDIQKSIENYLFTFISLKHTTPKLTPMMQIVVEEKFWPQIDETPFVAVDGRFLGSEWTFDYLPIVVIDFSEDADRANPLFDLEFFRWEEWLGMEVDEASRSQFTAPQITAHCLLEMTFLGFSQDSIEEEFEMMLQRIETFNLLSEEEKAQFAAAGEKVIESFYRVDEEE